MQTNDSIIYPWGELNTVHEWYNDTIAVTEVRPVKAENDWPVFGIGSIKVIIALALYSAVLAIAMYFQKKD